MALDVHGIPTTPPRPGEAAHARPPVPHPAPAVQPAAPAPAPAAPEPAPLIPSDLEATLAKLQELSAAFNRRLSFTVNEKLGQVIVKVVDSETDKVVREIPPAELQHVYERIREVIGLLFDERA